MNRRTILMLGLVWTSFPLSAAHAQSQAIIAYENADFGGASQSFAPGVYRADRGQLDGVGNDKISSIKIPFGMSVDVYEDVGDDGRGDGDHAYFDSGNHNYVGEDNNDKISVLAVRDFSATHFSTDDPRVPANTSVSIDGSGLHITIGSSDDRYYKRYEYGIPDSCVAQWWEATKAGNAGWEARVRAEASH